MTVYSIPVLINSTIVLYVGFYNLFLWLELREKKDRLYFFGICISVGIYDIFSFLLYNSQSFETSIWCQRGQFSSVGFIAFFIIMFINKLFNQKMPFVFKILLCVYITFIFISWIDSPIFLNLSNRAEKNILIGSFKINYKELAPGPAFNILYLFIIIGIIVAYRYLIMAYNNFKEKRLAFILIGFTIFFIANINDILLGANLIKSVYLLEYSFLALILIMDYFMLKDFVYLYNNQKEYLKVLEKETQEKTKELEISLNNIKKLSGLIPICASCKKVRTDKGYWQQVEEYIAEHSDAGFSHGICPDCVKKLYPEHYEQYIEMKKKRK